MNQILKKYALSFTLIMMVILSLSLYFGYETEVIEPDIEKDLRAVATPNYLEQKILEALANDNIDDANRYRSLANYLNIKIQNQAIDKALAEANSFLPSALRETQNFFAGFATGEGNNSASMAGSIVSDMTLIGDGRDVYQEGTKMAYGEAYDEFTLGIASIGLVLTASTYVTIGSTAPLKVGASIVKIAHKTQKISAPFMKIISSKISQSVDFSLLKKIDWSSFATIKASTKTFTQSVNLLPIEKLLAKLTKISQNSSQSDALNVIKYIDTSKELDRVVILSSKFKKHTVAVFKILGKGALKSGKVVMKYTRWIMTQIISLILSFLSLIGMVLMRVVF